MLFFFGKQFGFETKKRDFGLELKVILRDHFIKTKVFSLRDQFILGQKNLLQ